MPCPTVPDYAPSSFVAARLLVSSPLVSTLLIEAPVNRHFAQLHRDPQALTDAVALYLQTGLRRSNPVVVIASPYIPISSSRGCARTISTRRCFSSPDKLELHDADQTLRKFMRNDMPDWEDFRRADGIRLRARSGVRARYDPRVYGGTVNLLWQEGKQEAAIRLEEYWKRSRAPVSVLTVLQLHGSMSMTNKRTPGRSRRLAAPIPT